MLFNDPAARRKSINELKDYTCRFILFPNGWKNYSSSATKLAWTRIRFDATIVDHLPDDKSGVYSFVLEPEVAGHSSVGYLLYVGKAAKQSLLKRCRAYLYESANPKGRPLVQEMIDRWGGYLWLHFATVDDPTLVGQLESDLIEAFVPPCNDEFPATIQKAVKAIYRC